MTGLLREYLPHAPDLGLFIAPEIPESKLRAALRDYAPDVPEAEVLALYDATRLGSAKDGAVFLADRFVFQNNDLQTPRAVRYEDIVGVRSKRQLLGGRRVDVEINRGRATITETLDFSAQGGAAEYVERFLHEAMLRGASAAPVSRTDRATVEAALARLVASGALTEADRAAMLAVLA
ncbi:MAG: hypothetical protein AAGI52_05955 [Bacteroidota bacterium]